MKRGDPEWFNAEFCDAHRKEDKVALRKLRQQLEKVDNVWVHNLFRLLINDKVTTLDYVCIEYVTMLLGHKRGHEIIDHAIKYCLNRLERKAPTVGLFVIIVVILARYPGITKQMIVRAMNDQTFLYNVRMLLIRIQRDSIEINVCDETLFTIEMVEQSLGRDGLFRLIVPFELMRWTQGLVEETRQIAKNIDCAINVDLPAIDEAMTVEIWERIRHEAKHTLHTAGDKIELKISRLNQANIYSATLIPNGHFPNARVDIVLGLDNEEYILDATLEDGRLHGVDHMWNDEFRMYFGYVICVGYLHVVSGSLYQRRYHNNGSGGNGECRKKVPIPHILKLRQNFQPSPGAISNCLQRLGRAPQPGYTFRVPQRGALIGDQRGTITFTEKLLNKYTAA